MENTIKSGAQILFIILIVSHFRHSVRKAPVYSSFTISLSDSFLLWFLHLFVETDIDKTFLIKEGLCLLRHHFLCGCLDTESSDWLDELCARWKISLFLHLSQILLHLWFVLWIWNFIYVISQHVAELRCFHGFGKSFELWLIHIKFLAFDEWVVNGLGVFFSLGLLLFKGHFWFDFHPAGRLRCVWVEWHLFYFWCIFI